MELTVLTLTEAARLIEQRKVSPVELTHACLARIERLEPLLRSFITVTAETALAQAREAEMAIARGEYRGPLHGMPLALKDVFETKGIRTTAGSRMLEHSIPDRDGTVVQRLREAGAISLGKLNMSEWAMRVSDRQPSFDRCNNPWAIDRIPGGSSSGAGAALAAALCLGAFGTDTGGSIRIPAALCGVVGLKPTYGRVSRQGVIPLSWSLDHVGPMARRVVDVGLLLQAVAGYDADDPASISVPGDNYTAQPDGGIRGWHVALAFEDFGVEPGQVDTEVLEAVRKAAQVFEQLGAHVSEVKIEEMHEAGDVNSLILRSEAAAFHRRRMLEQAQDFGDDVLESLLSGTMYSAVEYALARQTQRELRRWSEQFFERHDILLTPTTPNAATRWDEPEDVKSGRPSLTSFTAAFNLAGLPALSVPCGFTASGVPIGLQVVGPRWAEARVLRTGYAYEQGTEWHNRRPEF